MPQEALVQGSFNGTPTFANGQFVNCAYGFNASPNSANLENVLFENVQTDFFNLEYATINVENSTFSSSSIFNDRLPPAILTRLSFQPSTIVFFANVTNLTNNPNGTDLTYGVSGTYNGFLLPYSAFSATSRFAKRDSLYPFQTDGRRKMLSKPIVAVFHDAGVTTGESIESGFCWPV